MNTINKKTDDSKEKKVGHSPLTWIVVLSLISMIGWQVYSGYHFKKVGVPGIFEVEFDQQDLKQKKIDYGGLYDALFKTVDLFISYSQQPPKADLEEYNLAEKAAKYWLVENKLNADQGILKRSEALLLKIRTYTRDSNKVAEFLGGDGRPDAKKLRKWSDEFQNELNGIEKLINQMNNKAS